MSARGGGLIQMILSRAIGRHLSSGRQPLTLWLWPLFSPFTLMLLHSGDRAVCCVCTFLCNFNPLSPHPLTLANSIPFSQPQWALCCYKNISVFTLSSPLLSSWPRVTWHGAKHNYAATHNMMGLVSANQSPGWRPLTNERPGIPSLVFRQWWVRGRHVWRAESCVWIWGEMCEAVRGPWPLLSTCPGQGEQLGQIYILIITRRRGRRQGRPSELGKQRN